MVLHELYCVLYGYRVLLVVTCWTEISTTGLPINYLSCFCHKYTLSACSPVDYVYRNYGSVVNQIHDNTRQTNKNTIIQFIFTSVIKINRAETVLRGESGHSSCLQESCLSNVVAPFEINSSINCVIMVSKLTSSWFLRSIPLELKSGERTHPVGLF